MGRISKAFLKAGTTHTVPPMEHGPKEMDTIHTGHEGGVCVTVRQCAPVLPIHLYRVAVDAEYAEEWVEPLRTQNKT